MSGNTRNHWSLADLARHPIGTRTASTVRTLLTLLLLSSCFTVSALLYVGAEFIGVIDQTQLFLALVFYIAVATVAVQIIMAVGRALANLLISSGAASKFLLAIVAGKLRTKTIAKRYRRRQENSYRPSVVLDCICSVFVLVLFVVIGSINDPITAIAVSQLVGLWVTLAFATLGIVLLLIGHFSKMAPENGHYMVLSGRYIILAASVLAGITYVQYLQSAAPKLTVEFRDPKAESVRATVVAPATNGLLMFFAGDDRAHYVPWDDIRRLIGHPTLNGRPATLPNQVQANGRS